MPQQKGSAVLLRDAAVRAIDYLASLEARKVAPSAAAIAALSELDEPLPRAGCDPRDAIALLDRVVSPATMAMAGPRFFGFVIGGALPAALAANWLAAAWDQNAALYDVTPAASPFWSRWPWAGWSICSACRPAPAAPLSPGRPWPTSRRWRPRATRAEARRLERGGRRPVRRAADHRDRAARRCTPR